MTAHSYHARLDREREAGMAGLLEGKAGLVTGAAGGIGRGIAIELGREGAHVLVSDLEHEADRAAETVALIEGEGGSASFQACDVTSGEAQEVLVQRVVERHGRLDFAVNNAGIAVHGELTEMTDQDYARVLDVNLRGIFLGMRAQVRTMVAQGGGSIVNMASVAGLTGVPLIGVYTASKHGIVGLTKNTAMEYGGRGVRVNCVCPNAIRTPLAEASPPDFVEALIAPQAIKRLGEPEEVGAPVAFLLSDKASFITGVALPIDGGYLTGA
jgi:NAD(P)-dependent dehydrogenase (short-subunit alcohol dehydrogenase family)